MSKIGLIILCLLMSAILISGYLKRHALLRMGAESLVCESSNAQSDIIFIDHVEENYLLFKWARRLQGQGLASTVLIPILDSDRNGEAFSISSGFVEVMCRTAQVLNCNTFFAPLAEPISLNLAKRSAEELKARNIHSILFVTSGFRSRRAYMIYSGVFNSFGIDVHCQPVFGKRTVYNWFDSAHGIQEVVLQFMKLWYYRLLVMR